MKFVAQRILLLFTLSGCVISFSGYGQKTGADSLTDLLNNATTDTAKASILNKIASYYKYNGEFGKGLEYAFKALKAALPARQPRLVAEIQRNIGTLYWNNNQFDSAIIYEKEAEKYYSAKGPPKDLLKAYKNLGGIYSDNQQYLAAIDYYNKVIDLAKELKDSLALHFGYNSIGGIYDKNDEYQLAIDNYNKALDASLTYKVYLNALSDYVEIGNIYGRQGIFPSALQAYLTALKINNNHLKNDNATAIINVNIGNIYNDQHDTLKAMNYYRNARKLFEKLDEKEKLGILMGDIGNVYMEAGDYTKAEFYQQQALAILLKTDDKAYLSICYTNLGEFYLNTKQYPKSLEYYDKALQMQESSDDWEGQAYTLSGLSKLYSKMGDYKKAEEAGLGGFDIAQNTNLVKEKKDFGMILSDLYEKINQPAKALYYYKQYISARDTMENKKNSQKMIRAELNYEYTQKQQAQKLEDEKKDALNAEKANHERRIRNLYLGGLVIVFLLTILLLRNFIRVRKANRIITEQKSEVEQQKSIVEQKNRDITDSINYAKRIQQAMLPTVQVWDNFFKRSFIYYKPKDIVSGDFYWCMALGSDVIVAVADCTGHGVPGAFMSMLGVSSLNKIVGERGIKEPGKILNALRDEIIKSLNPEGKMEEVKDGMDMSLCYISPVSGTLEYAAANNPLWIMRNNGDGVQLVELEADKMPVGKYLEEGKQFTSHKVEIKKGDRVYMFTDGYADQFGGERGKKFKYRHLQDILLSWQGKNMKEQKELLEKTMSEWKGNLEQVDDMLVAGIEIV